MQVAADRVVLIHYVLKDEAGTIIDTSAGSDPLAYIQGHGNIVAGLEKALEGKSKGDRVVVSVSPEEGYGTHDADLIQRVPKRAMQGAGEINKGMQFQARTEDGIRVFTVTGVVGDMVTLDGNHPLADKTLNFEVDVVEVRDATAEELEHGHVHGPGGHHH